MNSDKLKKIGTKYLGMAKELEKEPSSFDDLVFKRYIHTESIKDVVKQIKALGIKKDNGTLYKANDISNILKNKNSDTDQLIKELALLIFNKNMKGVIASYG